MSSQIQPSGAAGSPTEPRHRPRINLPVRAAAGGYGVAARQSQRRLVAEMLPAPGTTTGHVIKLAERAAEWEHLADQLGSLEESPPVVACRAGCAWCCRVPVGVTAPEILRIAAYLRATLSPVELQLLGDRLNALDARTGRMDLAERTHNLTPCALLVANRCSVYPVRPVHCRGLTSSDAGACQAAFTGLSEERIPLDEFRVDFLNSVVLGLIDGLKDVGLDGEELDLTTALRIALDLPDAADRWLAGEPVFAPARWSLRSLIR